MPLGAAESRAEQLATLEVIAHEILTTVETGDLISRAEQDGAELDDWQRANLREIRRTHGHATAVPADLVEARSKAVSRCEVAWRKARAESDFASLLPLLSEVLICERKSRGGEGRSAWPGAVRRAAGRGTTPARVRPISTRYSPISGSPCPPCWTLRWRIRSACRLPRRWKGPFPTEVQRGLCQRLMTVVGLDFTRGRLDVSTHPFCGGATDDVRITNRYQEGDFSGALMGVLHESGHGLYQQGRPPQWLRQPVGRARGMSLHESQSLLIEMQVCRSRAFTAYLAPLLREAFGARGAVWDADALYRHMTRVRPGFIRVDADEVTYPAHIIVRYELEKALIAGEMTLADLPAAFNAGIRELLGLTVTEDRLGCLQDIHWPGGAWGYFPTYTLGAMMAAQLFDAACRAEPDVVPGIGRGDFVPLVSWLRANVHAMGSSASTGEILTRATGRPLDAAVYRHHLHRRYLGED